MRRCGFVLFLLLVIVFPVHAQEELQPLNVYNGPIPEGARTFYLAPDGDNTGSGSAGEPWQSIHFAVQQLQAGDVLVLRGGVYDVPAPVGLGIDGTPDQPIVIVAYPGEVPIFDFSGMTRARNNHGFRLNGDWWHLIGFTIRYAAHNGIRMDGSHNILEQITAYENVDTGIHMAGGASHNLVLNCDSFRNFDPPAGGNADGFSAKFEVGPGNVFRGCRAWNNSDDGWDLWEAHNVVVIDSSWAFGNGDREALGGGEEFNGNGNGFKLGGGNVPATRPNVGHVVTRSIAFDNVGSGNAKGFDNNNNFGGFRLEHNTAFRNGRNFVFPFTVPEQQSVFVNNLGFDHVGSTNVQTPPLDAVFVGNSWQQEAEITSDMFVSLDADAAKAPRNPDGTLPDVGLARPLADAVPVDAGVPVGRPFYGAAPDMGAVEVEQGALTEGWMHRGSGDGVQDLRVYDVASAAEWSVGPAPAPGADAFGDGSYTIASLPPSAVLRTMIRTAPSSATRNYFRRLADFTLAESDHVLVAHADAIAPKPQWLGAFEEMDEDVVLLDAGGDEHTLSVFRYVGQAGESISLGRNSLDGTTDAPMYLAFVGTMTQAGSQPELPRIIGAELRSIYPNPISDRATIDFVLAQPGAVRLRVFDTMGRQVAAVAEGFFASGHHTLQWNAGTLANGMYHVRLETGEGMSVRSVIKVR